MSRNFYYPPPSSSGAGQGTYYQSTTSAGPGSALPATASGASQQHKGQIPTLEGYSKDCVKAFVALRNDPENYSWKQILDKLKNDFGIESLPAVNVGMLRKAFERIEWEDDKSTLGAASTSQQGGPAAYPAAYPTAPVGGSFGTPQAGYNPTYATPQSYPGSSYGAPQSNPGSAFGAPQTGPWVQHAPSHLGSGGPYASTPGTNPQPPQTAPFDPVRNQGYGYGGPYAYTPNTSQQFQPIASPGPARNQHYGYGHQYAPTSHTTTPQLPPTASFDPAWIQNCGYGGQFASPPNTNPQLPPVASLAQGNQGDYYGGSYTMTPGTGLYQEEDIGSKNEYTPATPTGRFSQQELQWISERASCICPGYGWKQIAKDYKQTFGKEGVYYHHLSAAYNQMHQSRGNQ